MTGYQGDQQTSRVEVLGQHIAFRLREPQRRIDRVKAKELRPKPGEYVYDRYRYEPTGALELRLGERYSTGSCFMRDGKEQRLEGFLNEAMVALVEAAVALNKRDERLRLEQIERERLARLAYEERRQDEGEKRRLDQLIADAEGWRRAEQLRAFVSAVEAAIRVREPEAPLPMNTAAWLAWAYFVADEMDPLLLAAPVAYLAREPAPPQPAWMRA